VGTASTWREGQLDAPAASRVRGWETPAHDALAELVPRPDPVPGQPERDVDVDLASFLVEDHHRGAQEAPVLFQLLQQPPIHVPFTRLFGHQVP